MGVWVGRVSSAMPQWRCEMGTYGCSLRYSAMPPSPHLASTMDSEGPSGFAAQSEDSTEVFEEFEVGESDFRGWLRAACARANLGSVSDRECLCVLYRLSFVAQRVAGGECVDLDEQIQAGNAMERAETVYVDRMLSYDEGFSGLSGWWVLFDREFDDLVERVLASVQGVEAGCDFPSREADSSKLIDEGGPPKTG